MNVVWAGDFSWQTVTETSSTGFTEQNWEGEDVLIVAFLGTVLVAALVLPIFTVRRFPVNNARWNEGLFAMAGSLVGRIALTLIMAEGSVFISVRSRGDDVSDSDADDAEDAAQAYKYVSWFILVTIFLGDGICASLCWFRIDDRKRSYYRRTQQRP